MSNTEYITAPVNSDHGGGVIWYDANIVAHDADIEFQRGNPTTWTRDTTGGASAGSIFTSSGGSMGSSSSGKSHTFNYKLETAKNGLFPSMKGITGFSYQYSQTSTAGHAFWLKRVGIEVCSSTGGSNIRWGSYDLSKRNDYDWHTDTRNFNSSDNTAFQNSYFYRAWFHLSTEGGSFTASNTYVKIRNFKLLYNHGTNTNNRWVVGKYRPKEKAGDEAIQGK